MATKEKELINPQSCFNRAEAGEPLFVLLGRDAAAPFAIRQWIHERVKSGKNQPLDPEIVDAENAILQFAKFRVDRAHRISERYADEQSRPQRHSPGPVEPGQNEGDPEC